MYDSDCTETETNSVFNRINEKSIDYSHVNICGDFNANEFDSNKCIKFHTIKHFGHFPAIGIFYSFTTKKEIKTYKIRNVENIDRDEIEHFVGPINWSVFFLSINSNVDRMIEYFYTIVNIFLNEICTEKVIQKLIHNFGVTSKSKKSEAHNTKITSYLIN